MVELVIRGPKSRPGAVDTAMRSVYADWIATRVQPFCVMLIILHGAVSAGNRARYVALWPLLQWR